MLLRTVTSLELGEQMARRFLGTNVVFASLVLCRRWRVGAERIHGNGQRHIGRGDAGRDRRSRQPVLIEKVRPAVTDENGPYRIVDLRPGTYTLTFTLPGSTR